MVLSTGDLRMTTEELMGAIISGFEAEVDATRDNLMDDPATDSMYAQELAEAYVANELGTQYIYCDGKSYILTLTERR